MQKKKNAINVSKQIHNVNSRTTWKFVIFAENIKLGNILYIAILLKVLLYKDSKPISLMSHGYDSLFQIPISYVWLLCEERQKFLFNEMSTVANQHRTQWTQQSCFT